MKDTLYRYSEIFYSPQGEGVGITGDPCVWIRWFLCNLQCNGFGQKDPANKDTYELPYKEFDLTGITELKQLPIFDKGCDSSYSWSKKYKHLCQMHTAVEIADNIVSSMRNDFNPNGLFNHPHSREQITLTMTGGEPLFSQPAMLALLEEFENRNNKPHKISIETNGTQMVKEELEKYLKEYLKEVVGETGRKWFWSVSPKLFNTSGEIAKRAIVPKSVAQYARISNNGQLKFVVNGSEASWDELEDVIKQFRKVGIKWPVSIMPVGATVEDQSLPTVADIANETVARGYHVSARVQAYLFGNVIGV